MTARPDLFVFLASLIVILCGFLLVPDSSDYADLRFRDGDVLRSLSDSLGLSESTPEDAEAGFILSRTQVHMGDVDGAENTIKNLIEHGADDPILRIFLARILSSVGRQSESLDHLLAVQAHRLDEDARVALAGWLRYEGRRDDERAYLELLESSALATDPQKVRLAMIQASNGDTEAATAGMRTLDDAQALAGHQPRLTLLSLLLDSGFGDEARIRAKNWKSSDENRIFEEEVQRIFDAYKFDYETD